MKIGPARAMLTGLVLCTAACSGEPPWLQAAGPDAAVADGAGNSNVLGLDAWRTADSTQTQQSDSVPVVGSDGPPLFPDNDSAIAPDYGKCAPVVPNNPKDAWLLRSPSAGFGGIETKSSGGHSDVFLKSPNNLTRIGARLDWGGTLVFFGLSADPNSNVIDDNDTGRELQIALYDQQRLRQGCAHDASCPSGGCGAEMTFLGWNPVQGGDECGHGAKVLSHGQKGDSLELVTQPIQWNPDWQATTCVQSSCPAQGVPVQVTYTTELRFLSEHLVEVSIQVTSQEPFSHQPTGQEWPTMYVSYGAGGDPDLRDLFDSDHNLIAITQPGSDNLYHQFFTSPDPWVAFQNSQGTYGVGLAMDQGVRSFVGFGGPQSAIYFHNVRASVVFGLDAGGTVRGRSYVALGDFNTIKAELEGALKKRPPFGWLDGPPDVDTTYQPGSKINVRGWALDTDKVNAITIKIDGAQRATIPVSGQRPDVCKVYPAYGGCPQVGFNGEVSTAGLDADCPHLLQVIATDSDGNSSILGERKLIPHI